MVEDLSKFPEELDLINAADNIDQLRVDAELALRKFNTDAAELDEDEVSELVAQYTELTSVYADYEQTLGSWIELDVSSVKIFEIERLQAQIKRTQLVSKNILRLGKAMLGIVDLEQRQEEIQMMLMGANFQAKDR